MSASSVHADSFARVSTALLAVWPSVADPATGLSKAEMGRVLDECGSDYRPLVDLLVDLGRVVRPALVSVPAQTAASWVHVRAPLVHRLVSTRYLQPDVARWAVDVWGRAVGVAPVQPVAAPTVEWHADAPSTSAATGASPSESATPSRAVAGRTPPAKPPVLTPQQVPAALKKVPSWAGGPVSFRVGQKPKSASLAQLAQSGRVVVRGSVAPGPMFQPAERRAALILGALLVVVTLGLLNAFASRPNVTTPVDAVGTATMAAMGMGAAAALPTVEARGAEARTAEARTAEALPADARMAGSGVAPGMTPLPRDVSRRVRDAGVGGRYVVTQRVRDVSGSESCEAVAQALAAGRESEETVSHVPGQAIFTLVTRGVTGTLDSDGEFVSEPRTGTTNNVNWRFRMRGRFGPEGFTGESETHTDAILRWGKIQTCVVTAELTGRRRLN